MHAAARRRRAGTCSAAASLPEPRLRAGPGRSRDHARCSSRPAGGRQPGDQLGREAAGASAPSRWCRGCCRPGPCIRRGRSRCGCRSAAWRRRRTPASKWPRPIQMRAVSSTSSAPLREHEFVVAGGFPVALDGEGDVGVDVVLRGAGREVGRALLAGDGAPREQRAAVHAPSRARGRAPRAACGSGTRAACARSAAGCAAATGTRRSRCPRSSGRRSRCRSRPWRRCWCGHRGRPTAAGAAG